MSEATTKRHAGRPRKPENLRKSKNKATVYISDDSLTRLGLKRENLTAFFDTIVTGRISELETNDGK